MTKRLAFMLLVLLALASCAIPPQTLPVAPLQAEQTAVSLAPWGHLWPRIFTTDGDYDLSLIHI